MLVTKSIEIDMGHRVPNHNSKCRNLHGHRYKIEVGVDDKVVTIPGASNEGMVIDFGDLKQGLVDCIERDFDHSLTIWFHDDLHNSLHQEIKDGMKINIVNFIPTAENLARHWFHILKGYFSGRIKLKYVKVWETPTSTATYEE